MGELLFNAPCACFVGFCVHWLLLLQMKTTCMSNNCGGNSLGCNVPRGPEHSRRNLAVDLV